MTEAFAALRLETEQENARNAQEHTKKGCIIYICVLYLHVFTVFVWVIHQQKGKSLTGTQKDIGKQKPLNLEPGKHDNSCTRSKYETL